MVKLTNSLNAWNTSAFRAALKTEIEQIDINLLSLQQAIVAQQLLIRSIIHRRIVVIYSQQSLTTKLPMKSKHITIVNLNSG